MSMNHSWTVMQNGSIASPPLMSLNMSTTTPVHATTVNEWAPFTLQQIRDAYWFQFILYPILLVCCTVGNTLTLLVLSQTAKKGSTNAYMMTVAVANLFVLWLYFPNWLRNIGLKNDPNFMVPFYNFYGLQMWGLDTFVHLSDWTLIAFSLERLLAITKPLTFRRFQSAKYARIISVVLLFLSGAAAFYTVFDWYYYRYYSMSDHKKYYTTIVNVTGRNTFALREWGRIQAASEVSISLGTFFLLLLINVGVVLVIVAMSKDLTVGKKSGDQKRRSRQHRNSILILLGSVALYLVTQFPAVLYNILLIANNQGVYSMGKGSQYMGAIFVSQIQQINYALNFFIYVICGNQFRLQFLEVFGKTRLVKYFIHRKRDRTQAASLGESGGSNLAGPRKSSNGSISSKASSQSSVVEMELTPSNGNSSGGSADKARIEMSHDTPLVKDNVTNKTIPSPNGTRSSGTTEAKSTAFPTKVGSSETVGISEERI